MSGDDEWKYLLYDNILLDTFFPFRWSPTVTVVDFYHQRIFMFVNPSLEFFKQKVDLLNVQD